MCLAILKKEKNVCPEDGILQVNRSGTSVFCLPNCTLRVNAIFESASTKNICNIIMPTEDHLYQHRKVNKIR